MYASCNGNTEIVQLLLTCRAYTNIQDYNGKTALIHASRTGNTEIVQLLLTCGADINIQDYGGSTALQWVTTNGNKECIKLLENHIKKEEISDNKRKIEELEEQLNIIMKKLKELK